ncbi:MAG: hypothetical protein RIT43_360 [Bacteroidota bacterium]|jgi:hypothetical protein
MTLERILIGVLFVTLSLLVLIIAYRKLLAYLGKGQPVSKDYCTLYSLEQDPAAGEIEIYFTTDSKKNVILELLDQQGDVLQVIKEGDFGSGGHIVRLDTRNIANGTYSYQLRTENQKTMKRFRIEN